MLAERDYAVVAAQPLMVLSSSCWPRPPLPLRAFRSHLSSVRAAERTSQLPPSPYKKRHALLTFGYCGTNYWGLQSQTALGDPERPTVSDIIRRALLETGGIAESNLAPLSRTKWTLASRTDKGVHAVGAAASLKLETLDDEIVLGEAPSANEAVPWHLSPAAVERINALLPADIRVFGATRVRKSFHARMLASSRSYEYLLPKAAIGSCAVSEFDALLRTFEGTHRMHNFASGLRQPPQEWSAGGESWTLALDPASRHPQAWRSVLRCRVVRELRLGGTEYLLVSIRGLSFVLHQIRHMIGAAIAVANGVFPADTLPIALSTPLQVDVSPLAPGCGLLLDRVDWFDMLHGVDEAETSAHAAKLRADFKEEVLLPHIDSLYSTGHVMEQWRDGLLEGRFTTHYADGDLDRLRRMSVRWEDHREELVAARRQRRDEARASREAEEAAAAAGADAPTAGDAAAAEAAADAEGAASAAAPPAKPKEPPPAARGGRPGDKKSQRPPRGTLPSGLQVRLLVHFDLVPGPEAFAILCHLEEGVSSGELQPAQSAEYYLEAAERFRAAQ